MARVLFATRAWESPEIEGGYLLLKDIARQLAADLGDDFEACFLAQSEGRAEGVTLLPAFHQTGWGNIQKLDFFRGLLRHLGKVDVVHLAHTPTLTNALFIRLLKRLYPAVTFIQTVTGFGHIDNDPKMLFWGDVITTISPRVSEYLKQKHGIRAEVLIPYPQPDRLSKSAPIPANLSRALSDAPVVVFPIDVFRLDLERFDLVELSQQLIREHPEVRLIFLDRFGDEKKIHALLSDVAEESLLLLPIIPYMASLIRRATVVAFPMSDVDGKFNPPMVLLEALHYHRVVVCSNAIDLEPGDYVRKVASLDCDDWVRAISGAIETSGGDGASLTGSGFKTNCRRYQKLYMSAAEGNHSVRS